MPEVVGNPQPARTFQDRQGEILRAVTLAADRFLRSRRPLDEIDVVLAALGEATGVARTHVFEAERDGERWLMSQRNEWCAPGVQPEIDNPELQRIDLAASGLGTWLEHFVAGRVLMVDEPDFTPAERAHLGRQGIRSLLVFPVEVEGRWWGSIGYDDTRRMRDFSQAELDALGASARVLGSGIQQHLRTEAREREQARLAQALERERLAAERLRELEELKDSFIAAVSHELRTPLTSICGFAQTLEEHDPQLDDELREQLYARLSVNAHHLSDLVGQLLELNRLGSTAAAPARADTDLARLVEDRLARCTRLDGKRRAVDLRVTTARIDPEALRQILDSLLDNVARHAEVATCVTVRSERRNGSLLLTVEDDGQGVPEALRQAVFEPFRHGPSAPRHAPGVGIGLSLVARLAAANGGRAWIEEPGAGGTRVCVLLSEPADHDGLGVRAASEQQDPSAEVE